ncbi:MAG: hypothetical protein HQ559_12480 [Lentisphaerae bacterium]|nr:hypothetical protein [Lentisphaerota bacterium]
MNMIRDVVSRALAAEGAAVENIEPEGLEVLATPQLASALAIDEFSRLGFGRELPSNANRVSLESEWLNNLENLVSDKGSCLRVVQPGDALPNNSFSPDDLLPKVVVLENATYGHLSTESAWTRFLFLVFRVAATSDEKREDLLTVCINESNGAYAHGMSDALLELLRREKGLGVDPPGTALLDPPWSAQEIARWNARYLPARVRRQLQPFLSGMERRMAKDIERLYAYHTRLRREAADKILDAENRNKADEKLRRREELRMGSIEREYLAKVADLRRKYAMNVELSFVQALRLIAPVKRVRFDILRRKGVRPYHLDWNAISRDLDALPCESCGLESASHAICDEHLHILCHACLAPCPDCGKPYCQACHPRACPRCEKRTSSP